MACRQLTREENSQEQDTRTAVQQEDRLAPEPTQESETHFHCTEQLTSWGNSSPGGSQERCSWGTPGLKPTSLQILSDGWSLCTHER